MTSTDRNALAFDFGTTSLSGRLIDVRGRILAEFQLPNPQAEFGADVLRRLQAALDGRAATLQELLVDGINRLTAELCSQAGISSGNLSAAAAAANPAVTVLLRGESVEPLLKPPFRPESSRSLELSPGQFGLDLPVPLFSFPLVNGFVGGDLVAFLCGRETPLSPALFIDVGTNGEIALFDGANWRVTSVAAGPAFEGAEIGCGMLYGPGAIAACRIADDMFALDVVGGGSPVGVCGSGLAEIIASALEGGLLDVHGSLVKPESVTTNLSRYLVPVADGFELQLYRDATRRIVVEQKDIRSFQLAKAAVRAGVDCLLEKADLPAESIDEVVLTGAFGFSLSGRALKRVAMLPENMIDKVRFEPGGALSGVCRMLLLDGGSGHVESLARNLKPFPLSGTPAFEKAFLSSIDF